MYCCNQQGRCPRSDKGGDKPYCLAVPHGLCCPEYSDSYCETINNNPLGPLPDNWAESKRKSCCASVKERVPTLSCNPADVSINPPYCQQCPPAENVLDLDQVYRGFNEDIYSNPPDPCCVQEQATAKPWCCGRPICH